MIGLINVTFKQRMKKGRNLANLNPRGRICQAKGIISTKILRGLYAGGIIRIARRP